MNNNLLMIIFAFFVGYILAMMNNNMCGGRVIEGVDVDHCPRDGTERGNNCCSIGPGKVECQTDADCAGEGTSQPSFAESLIPVVGGIIELEHLNNPDGQKCHWMEPDDWAGVAAMEGCDPSGIEPPTNSTVDLKRGAKRCY